MEVHFVVTSFCFFYLFLFVSMSSDFSCKWPWGSNTPCVCHLLWLLILNHAFLLFILFLLATKAPLHGLECPALFSVSVCGCAELEIWRAEREWTCEENALSFPLLSYFFCFWFSSISLLSFSPGQSVCLSHPVCVSPYAPAFLLSAPPPLVSLSISLSSSDVVGCHWTSLILSDYFVSYLNIIWTITTDSFPPKLDVNFWHFLFPFVCSFINLYDLCL